MIHIVCPKCGTVISGISNGIEYTRRDAERAAAESFEGMEYCIVRTYSAGVFAGYIKKLDGKYAEVVNARRLWYWSGAASLSQLATDGTSKPSECKFPCEVSLVKLTEVIEVLECSKKAKKSIASVDVWKE
jgi:hypothetical protein